MVTEHERPWEVLCSAYFTPLIINIFNLVGMKRASSLWLHVAEMSSFSLIQWNWVVIITQVTEDNPQYLCSINYLVLSLDRTTLPLQMEATFPRGPISQRLVAIQYSRLTLQLSRERTCYRCLHLILEGMDNLFI